MRTKRVFIGIFGKRNQGKSSLINALAGQDIAEVSDIAGTTTNPVRKSIEVFGIGPVVFVDTAGIDDSGEIGDIRLKKTLDTLNTIDVAVLLIAENQFGEEEVNLIERLKYYNIPFIIVHNKADKQPLRDELKVRLSEYQSPIVECNTIDKRGIAELIDKIVMITPPSAYISSSLVGDFVSCGEIVVLVIPHDAEIPGGRLLFPELQIIRDIIDNNAIAVSIRPEELANYLGKQGTDLVITDSRVLEKVSKIVPVEVPLTSFSIVFARAKGNFGCYLEGTPKISDLVDGDTVLLLESCSHTSICEDIGRRKLPGMVQKFTGKKLNFELVPSLAPLPELDNVKIAIQCGGCLASRKQLENRIKEIMDRGIPVTNYGMVLAYVNGIFGRVTQIFSNN